MLLECGLSNILSCGQIAEHVVFMLDLAFEDGEKTDGAHDCAHLIRSFGRAAANLSTEGSTCNTYFVGVWPKGAHSIESLPCIEACAVIIGIYK
jgi:hypothetical protein